MSRRFLLLVVSLFCGWAAPFACADDSRRVVSVTPALSQERVRPGDHLSLAAVVHVQPGWHINSHEPRDEFLIPTSLTVTSPADVSISHIHYPASVEHRLAFAKQPLDVYEGTVTILAEAHIASTSPPGHTLTVTGTLSFQACNDTTCLAPADLPVAMALPVVAATEPVAQTHPELFSMAPSSGEKPTGSPSVGGWMGHLLSGHAIWLWFLAAFLGGLALNLTPCVYPMIPVTLAFFGGQAAGRLGSTVLLGILYVLGMSTTYAILGLTAAKTGAMFGSWLQQPAVLIGIAALIGALALSMFGLYELQPPRWIAQRFGQAKTGGLGALVMGMTVGFIAAPCIGPFVLGLLLFVSQLANPWLGFWLFLTMGLGMGLPYALLGVFANRLSGLPKGGAWLVWMKKLLGVLLLGLALYFLRPLLAPGLAHWVSVGGLGLAGAYLGWLERSRVEGAFLWARRIAGVACLAGAVALLTATPQSVATTSGVGWQPYSAARFEQAAREGRPVVIDVFADWCLPCVELDHVTFRHPQVIAQLSSFTVLRIDATQAVEPQAQSVLDRYDVYGVPTVLIFDTEGKEREDLRVNGFVTPQEFLGRLAKMKMS